VGRVLAVLGSGVAYALAFPPADVGSLAWVALVPLFLAAHGRRPPEAFWIGYAWGVVGLGGVFWWLTTFGLAVWVLAAVMLTVFPAATMGAIAAIAWAGHVRRGPLAFLWIATLWTAVEFLRSQGPLGLPWALLGESQHQTLVVSQIASVTGVYGVTFLVVLVNAALYIVVARRAIVMPVAVVGLALVGATVWGLAALRTPVPATVTAAVVQPGYSTRARWHSADAARDLGILRALTHEAVGRGASIVVWPETASPTDVLGDPATLAAIRSWARRDHVALIASSLEGGLTNSAFSFAPAGTLLGRYDKVRLVPFAEFGEQAGRASTALATSICPLGVAICWESVFPDLARREVHDGAQLLAVLTNDAWFDNGVAPAQHAAIAPFRAIEEGRYLLRAANGGQSLIIDPRGRVLASLPLGARGVIAARVAPLRGLTPYARFGDVFGWGAVLVGAALLLPAARPWLAAEACASGFVRLLAVSFLPLAVLVGVAKVSHMLGSPHMSAGGVAVPTPILAVLAVTVFLSRRQRAADLGFRTAGFLPAAAAGLTVVLALTAVAVAAFRAEAATPAFLLLSGGWWPAAVQALIVGVSLEWWLRGLVFTAAVAWRGWKPAVLWSALLGMTAAAPRGGEAMVWSLLSGLAFGLLRARWRQVPALALAHGVGNVLLGFVISPW